MNILMYAYTYIYTYIYICINTDMNYIIIQMYIYIYLMYIFGGFRISFDSVGPGASGGLGRADGPPSPAAGSRAGGAIFRATSV